MRDREIIVGTGNDFFGEIQGMGRKLKELAGSGKVPLVRYKLLRALVTELSNEWTLTDFADNTAKSYLSQRIEYVRTRIMDYDRG